MDCLFVSNLFPNPVEPGKGAYNRDQLVALTKLGLKVHVLSPLPWVPLLNPWKRGIPHEAVIEGIPVTYCRQLYLPLSRGAQNGRLYSWSIRRQLSRLIREHQPRFLWSSFAFPDGVGVGIEAKRHGLPHVVSLLGSDINMNRQYPARWREIMRALGEARVVFAKSKALRERVEGGKLKAEMGGKGGESDLSTACPDSTSAFSSHSSSLPQSLPPIHIDYNGVDQELFRPADRAEACDALGIDPAVRRILFVGNLVPVKDVATLIRAFAELRGRVEGGKLKAEVRESKRGAGGSVSSSQRCRFAAALRAACLPSVGSPFIPHPSLQLVIIGSGPEESRLRQLAVELGLAVANDASSSQLSAFSLHPSSVLFPGRLPRKQVSQWMQACDTFCLASLNEGVPNVVLEALACGTPVVASRVGGIAEVHPGDEAGALVEAGDVTALSGALRDTLDREWNPERLRAHVDMFTWEENAKNVLAAVRECGLLGNKLGGQGIG